MTYSECGDEAVRAGTAWLRLRDEFTNIDAYFSNGVVISAHSVVLLDDNVTVTYTNSFSGRGMSLEEAAHDLLTKAGII